jgi:glycosyltransferase involved in cell wall biosynthesis
MTDVEGRPAPGPLLTIIVPTYNRAENVGLLLRALRAECVTLDGLVTVLVTDNASTDHTSDVIRELQETWPELLAQRHATNCGPEENFCSGIDHAETKYFWIIGDDDCPKCGVVAKSVALLRELSPALVYMQSEWVRPIVAADQGEPVGTP